MRSALKLQSRKDLFSCNRNTIQLKFSANRKFEIASGQRNDHMQVQENYFRFSILSLHLKLSKGIQKYS